MKSNPITLLVVCLSLMLAARGDAGELNVPGDYPTIQEAVDASSSGDTIRIAAGIYREQAFINRSGAEGRRDEELTIVGEPGTILRAFEGMERSTPEGNAPLIMVFRSRLHIRGITFEGERLAHAVPGLPGASWLIGAMFSDSGGSVEDCHFHGFRNLPDEHPDEGAAPIAFFNDLATSVLEQVRVTGNTIVDSHLGIFLRAVPGRKTIDYIVTDNHITGWGPTSEGANGISVRGNASGMIRGNTISGFANLDTTAEFPFSFGVVIFDGLGDEAHVLSDVIVEGNVFKDNQRHLVMLRADEGTVRNNVFEGTAPEVDPGALFVSGKNVRIERNQFTGMETGITLCADDPTYGTILGIAEDAELKENRFSDVDDPIVRQPGASDTETDTLLAPFPVPKLDIAKAIVLSWKDFGEALVLEQSDDLMAPWEVLEVPVQSANGRKEVYTSLEAVRNHYRLRSP